jgi:LPXTG-motif cell wall-anchored protein
MQRWAVLLVALVLALPATALAQGAGDNQYQDPFSGQGGSNRSSSSSSSSGSSSSSSGDSQLSGSPPAGQAGRTLPATGGQPVTLALLGAGLLLAGVGVRLRLRKPVG